VAPRSEPNRATAVERTCLLVRHAQALNRKGWERSDDERPLSPRGKQQAKAIAATFGASPIRKVLSSPAERCLSTVAPLAEAVGCPVGVADYLTEGSGGTAALENLLAELAALERQSVLVACSHGDVLTEIAGDLSRSGVFESPPTVAKGAALLLKVKRGVPVAGELVPAPR
jgi:broad specificity phosphatase PhoE